MKTQLNILIILSVITGFFIIPSMSMAADYPIEESRRKIWKVLQEERPDYYNERTSAEDSVDSHESENYDYSALDTSYDNEDIDTLALYENVEQSDSILIDKQNEFIYSSQEEEAIQTEADWSADLGETDIIKIVPKEEPAQVVEKKVAEVADPVMEKKAETTKAVIKNDPKPMVKKKSDTVKKMDEVKLLDTEMDSKSHDKAVKSEKKGILKGFTSIFKGKSKKDSMDVASKDSPVSHDGKDLSSKEKTQFKEMKKLFSKMEDKEEVKIEPVKMELPSQKVAEDVKKEPKVIKKPMKEMVKKDDNKGFVNSNPQVQEKKEPIQKTYKTFSEQQEQYMEEVKEEADQTSVVVKKIDAATDDDSDDDEKFWKKVQRKMSVSGMLPEEVAELDYWEVPVEEQKVEDISRSLKIDEAFKEAAEIELPSEPIHKVSKIEEEEELVVTPLQIIRKAIPKGYREKRIDLDFDDTNLSDILLIMGDAGNMNIVLDPALKSNTLDLHLKQVKLEDALLLVSNSYDLGFKLVGSALFVTANDKLKFENKVSKVIKVRNIDVNEAKELVEDLADKVNTSTELNSLIVIGDPEDVAKVAKIIKSIDSPQPQVVLEAKIIEVNKDALKDLGVDWSDQINLLYQESGRPQDFDDTENSTSGLYRVAQIQRNPIQFETTIRMLENQNKAKVLSAPRVTTLNGKEAEIFVGDEVPYTITNITGGVVTNDVRFVEPGIRLTITPSIIEDDFVVMKVEPEVSFIVAFRGPNDEFPQVRTREATAHVRVNNSQPFVLGGILNQEDKQSLFKVPFFGKLPLFGNLFSYERSTAVDTELIITVIPTIVNGQN